MTHKFWVTGITLFYSVAEVVRNPGGAKIKSSALPDLIIQPLVSWSKCLHGRYYEMRWKACERYIFHVMAYAYFLMPDFHMFVYFETPYRYQIMQNWIRSHFRVEWVNPGNDSPTLNSKNLKIKVLAPFWNPIMMNYCWAFQLQPELSNCSETFQFSVSSFQLQSVLSNFTRFFPTSLGSFQLRRNFQTSLSFQLSFPTTRIP